MRAAIAYAFHPDFPTESEINLGMLKRGFGAAESLAPKLEFVIFPTGTKVSHITTILSKHMLTS